MQKISSLSTSKAPQAIGPYSQAIRAGDFLFCSGQIPIDPETQALISGDVKAQTERVCRNLLAVLEAAGLGPDRIVKTTCYLKDMGSFPQFNEVYEKYLGVGKPARATVEVARLPKDVLVEVDLIAAY